MRFFLKLALAASAFAITAPAMAGVFILDGTDADDHGGATATANLGGWQYIQKALENIASSTGLTRTQKTIAVLGSNSGSEAARAAQSAVALSAALTGSGWNVVLLNDSQITDFFNNTGVFQTSNASVLYMDSGGNVGGGISSSEQAIIDGFATGINNFVGSGGGLFSMAQGYGWLSALIPGLTVVDESNTGISLTPAGNTNFPGLTNADLSTGPYHNSFARTGAIPILGTSNATGNAVILGGRGGSITVPGAVPEASTWMMMIAGFGIAGMSLRSRRRNAVASLA